MPALASALALMITGAAPATTLPALPPMASGYVFEDRNRNRKRDAGEPGLANVKVSNGLSITTTDRDGRWALTYDEFMTPFFVIKPRGWMTPVDEKQLPQFYYIHAPEGLPKTRYGGMEPTGPLPASIDFPLHRQNEPDKFKAIVFGDTQPRDLREVDYIARDVVEPLKGNTEGAMFGVTLGDIVFDNLDVMEPLAHVIAMIGLPWYNVLGNHDINFDTPDDARANSRWLKIYGPSYYSFEYGATHFVALDNVWWPGANNGGYTAALGPRQLAWLKEDLRRVPENQLVVLMMHIPIMSMQDADKAALFELIKDRPYVLSMSAHTHFQSHEFLGKEEGWPGQGEHHHVVTVTACGSWWQGAPDERGIPHTTMRDGAPNGYLIYTFDGNQYSMEFRAAGAPSSYQMNIYAPDVASSGDQVEIMTNVFGGSERSKVEIRIGGGEWQTMTKANMQDPVYLATFERDKAITAPYRPLPGAVNSNHIWRAELTVPAGKGLVPVEVRTTDMFGQVYHATRGIRLVDKR